MEVEFLGFISSWAQGIIVSVIIATIIEMLLPNNGNGKYVKVVVGIFVLFSIISPVINKLKGSNSNEIDLNSYIETSANGTLPTSNISFNNEETIRKMYEENLKIDIKSKVNQKGYTTGEIGLEILNNEEYTLNKINLKITAKNENANSNNNSANTTTIVENIENIKVSLGGSSKDSKKEEQSVISESEKRKLKEYLSGVYEVNENNIIIN